MQVGLSILRLATVAVLLMAIPACFTSNSDKPGTATPLKIGLLLNFTGSPEASADRQHAFELAIRHL